jgi:hypothetical protein
MAARLDPAHDERTRSKIQTSQLINRLMDHCLAPQDLMTNSQVNAAKLLLAKTLPDLSAVTVAGDSNAPLKMTFEWLKPSE